MSGLDAAAGIAGFLTLAFSCFQGCIKGYTLICKATSYGRDISGVRLMVELERHRFQMWAEEAGLFDSPRRLVVREPDIQYVARILEHLSELLLDVTKLKAKYDLDIVETDEVIYSLDEDNSTIAEVAPQQRKRISDIFKSKTSPWKKLKWITVDEKNIRRLLDDVKGFVDRLEKFLEHGHRMKLNHAFDTILRTAVVRSANDQELHVLGHDRSKSFSRGAIPAAARWRRQGLILGVLDISTDDGAPSAHVRSSLRGNAMRSPTSPTPSMQSPHRPLSSGKSMRISSTKITLPKLEPNTTRHFAWYETKPNVLEPVLLEWKTGRGRIKLQQLESRVDKVSLFLHELESSFHSLRCLGYLKDWERVAEDRYAYIFDLSFSVYPEAVQQSPIRKHMDRPPLPHMQTLRHILDRGVEMPSLNLRLHCAITLMETLLQLHTAGWLHKELRSDNILFIRRATLNPNIRFSDEDMLSSPMYIAGYVYARLDNPHELTEPTESGSENDLYRHPMSMGNSKRPFQKSFDIFSVGCILLELGLWKALPDILRSEPELNTRRRDSHQEDDLATFRRQISFRTSSSTLAQLSPRSSATSFPRRNSDNLSEKRSPLLKMRSSIVSIEEEVTAPVSPRPDYDLLELRHQLLLSNLYIVDTNEHQDEASNGRHGGLNGILKLLEGRMGTGYTRIVHNFLSVVEQFEALGKRSDSTVPMDEHAYALKLEMESLDFLRDFAKVV